MQVLASTLLYQLQSVPLLALFGAYYNGAGTGVLIRA